MHLLFLYVFVHLYLMDQCEKYFHITHILSISESEWPWESLKMQITNRAPNSHEILMFVSKTTQTMLWHHGAWLYSTLRSMTRTMNTIEHCHVTALFGIFWETNYQNLKRLRHPIHYKCITKNKLKIVKKNFFISKQFGINSHWSN